MTASEFIRQKLNEGYSKYEIRQMYNEYYDCNDEGTDKIVSYISFERIIRLEFQRQLEGRVLAEYEGVADADNIEYIAKAANYLKQKQSFQDQNRVNNKIARETARVSNVLEALNRELIAAIPLVKLEGAIPKLKANPDAVLGIIQLSDHHFNELIHDDEVANRFDFETGSKRLHKLVLEADRVFRAYGITKIFVAFLGDLINSDRRLDEVLHASTNRARATLLACHLYRQMLEDLIKRGYQISVSAVTGNESRAGEFNNFSDISATDNYDFTIFHILKIMFEKEKKHITFWHGDWKESVVSISGVNLLLLHGEGIKSDKDISSAYAKWGKKGTLIDFILHGHYHATQITDLSARSSSLCGANAYSDKQLNLYSKAGQNIHVVMTDKSIHNFKIDLQETGTVPGYHIVSELEEYCAKSARKLHQTNTILEIVV